MAGIPVSELFPDYGKKKDEPEQKGIPVSELFPEADEEEAQPKQNGGLLDGLKQNAEDAAITFTSGGLKVAELLSDAAGTVLSYGGVPAKAIGSWFDDQSEDLSKLGKRLDRMTGYGVSGFIDSAKAGVGGLLKRRGEDLEEYFRPENMTPSEWHERLWKYNPRQDGWDFDVTPQRWLVETGGDIQKRYSHEYPYRSKAWYADNLFQSSPESLAIMAASVPIGFIGGPVVGTGVGLLGNLATKAPVVARLLANAGNWYQGASTAAKWARKGGSLLSSLAPGWNAAVGGGAAAVLEASSERREAINNYIAEAKANGTYVKDKTELEAEAFGDIVGRDNTALISAFNLPQYSAFYRAPGRGWLNKLLWLAKATLPEGAEEAGQAMIPPLERGRPINWNEVEDASVIGMLNGGLMGGAGALGHGLFGGDPAQDLGVLSAPLTGYEGLTDDQLTELANAQYSDLRSFGDGGYSVSDNEHSGLGVAANESLRNWAKGEGINDQVFDLIVKESQAQGVDPKLSLSIAIIESTGDQSAISPAGAIGVMQLMPETADYLGVNPYNLEENIHGGVKELKANLDKYGGDIDLLAAGYNAGQGNVEKYGGVPPFAETQNYIRELRKLLAQAPDSGDKYSYDYGGARQDNGQPQSGGNSPSQGTVYLGENGGGEGKYWVKNTSMGATLDGAQPQTINALDILAKKYYEDTGKKLVLNAGTNGTSHAYGEHSHYTGWKLDVIDEYVEGEDSPLITADYQPGWYWEKFRDFGRSIGLGMNFEKPGERGVHIDIAIDGDNWIDKAPNSGGFSLDKVRAAANGTQGSPSSPSQGNEQGDAYDPEFSPRENEIWQWAQYASNRLRNEYQIRLAPELIFRQWWFEDSTQGKFDHPSHNFGGLTSIKPTNLPKPGGGYFAEYSSDKEFADAYVDDFMRLRKDEINAAADENGMMSDEAFIQAMLASGYMVEGDVPSYRANFPGIKAPSKRNSGGGTVSGGGGTSKTSPTQTPNVQPVDIPEEPKPLFDITAEDETYQNILKRFADERYKQTVSNSSQKDTNAFSGLFDANNSNVLNRNYIQGLLGFEDRNYTEEVSNSENGLNRIFNEELSDFTKGIRTPDLTDFANNLLAQEQQQAAPQPQAPSPKATQQPQPTAQGQEQPNAYLRNTRLKEAAEKLQQQARNSGNVKLAVQIENAKNNPTELENILQQNGITVSDEQPQPATTTQPTQDPVSQNETPENVLTPAPSTQRQVQSQTQPTAQAQPVTPAQPATTAQPTVTTQGQPATAQPTAPKRIGGVEGNTTRVLTDDRNRYGVKYKVVEADDLNASHNFDATTGATVNPNYPQEFQPRDRQRQAYQEHVEERANHLDPKRLMGADNVNQGAPVVRSDGVVLNGNGRVMSIRRAYDKGLGDNYRNALIANAQQLGLNGDEIAAMKKPVLVRETTQDLDVEALKPIVESRQGGEVLGATEQAMQDAQAIRRNPNILANVPQDGDLSSAQSQNFITDVLRAIVPENERNTVMNNGAPTAQGISRVRNALFALGYKDDTALQRIAEDPSDNIKRVTNAMVAAAPKFAQARTQMESLGLDQTYLDPLIQAVGKFKALRDAGSSVFRHLMDIPIEGMDNESEETKDILAFFEAHKGNQTEIAQFLRALADGILNYTETQGGLFGTSPLNLKNIIASARSQIEGTELTADMFQNEALRKQIAKQVHKTLQTGRSEGRKFLVNRLFSQAQNGDDFAVRMLNRFKGLNPTARDLQQEANPNETTSTSETTTAQGSQENPVQNAEPQQTQEPSQVKRYPKGSKAWKLHRKLKTDSHPNLREYADDLIERAQSRYEEVYKPARDRIDEILKTDYTDEQLDDWDNRLAAQSEASPEVQAESSSSEQPQATPNVEATPQVQADTESATVTTGEIQTEAKRKLSPVAWSPLQALSLDDTPETATIPHRLFKKLEHLPQFAESLLAQAQSDDEAVHTKARNEIQTILKGNFTDEELEARARLFDAQNDGQSTVKPPNAKRDRILGAKRPAGLKGKRYPEGSVGRKLQRKLKDAYPHLSQHVDDLLEKAKNDEDARTELKAILAASDEVLAEMEQNLAPQEEIQPTANVDETSNADETGETNDNRLPANVDESPSRESPSKRRLVKGRTGKIKRYSHGSKGFALHKKLQTEAHPNLREYADDLLERAAEGDEQARAEIDSVLDGYYSDELLDKWERILNPQEAEQSAEVQPGTRTEAQSETSAETQEETTPEAPKAEESKTSAEVQPETQSEPAPQEATEPESLSATEESSQTEAQTKPETESSQEGTTPQTQTQANEGASASTQEAESQRESTPESFKKFFRQLGKTVTLTGNPLEGKVSFNALLDALKNIARTNDGKLTSTDENGAVFTFTRSIDNYLERVIATEKQNADDFLDAATKYLSDIATGKEPLPQEKPKEAPKAKPQEDAKIENPYFAVVEKDGQYFVALKNKPFLPDTVRNTLTAKLDGLALYKGTSTNSVAGGGGTTYTLKNGERAYSFNSKQDLNRFLFDATRRFLEPIEKGNLTFTEQATARKAQVVNEEIEALLNDEIERAAKADTEIQAKAKAEAQAKAEKEAQAKAEAEKKAQAKAEAEREAQAKAEKEADMSEKFFETEPANGETQVSFYLSDYPLKGKITDKDALGGYLQKRAAQIGGELDEADVENGTWIFTFNKEEDAQTLDSSQ